MTFPQPGFVRRELLAGLLVAVSLCLFSKPAQGQWRVEQLEKKACTAAGAEYRHYSLGNETSGDKIGIQLVIFQPARMRLRIIDNPGADHDLAEAMTNHNCIAGVNGGYFNTEDAPVDLLRSEGKTISRLQHARLLSAVLAASGREVKIVRAGAFADTRAWRNAVQCGPFLIEHSKPVAGLDERRSARRTFAATTADHRAMLGFCEAVTLAQLAKILAAMSEIKIDRAINLDGGSSSAFWCRTNQGVISIAEQKTVRDFVAIAPAEIR